MGDKEAKKIERQDQIKDQDQIDERTTEEIAEAGDGPIIDLEETEQGDGTGIVITEDAKDDKIEDGDQPEAVTA